MEFRCTLTLYRRSVARMEMVEDRDRDRDRLQPMCCHRPANVELGRRTGSTEERRRIWMSSLGIVSSSIRNVSLFEGFF